MIIKHIEIAGFRGVRDIVRLDLPGGFAVITGRNGAGKSSVCDALEYALRGRLPGDLADKEKGEGWTDYVWWRGGDAPSHRHVKVQFDGPDGEFELARTYESSPEEKVIRRLFNSDRAPANPIDELCRTTIIRDDSIEQLSVALQEADRFAFVRNALGTASLRAVEARIGALSKVLEGRRKSAETSYGAARTRVSDATAALSAAKAQAGRIEGALDAEVTLRFITSLGDAPLVDVVDRSRLLLAELYVKQASMRAIIPRWSALQESRQAEGTADARARANMLAREIETASKAMAVAAEAASALEARLELAKGSDRHWTSLAELQEHGGRVGLQNGRCPLCASSVDGSRFDARLGEMRRQVDEHSRLTRELVAQRIEAQATAARAQQELERLQRDQRKATAVADALDKEESSVNRALREIVPEHLVTGITKDALLAVAEDLEVRVEALQKAMATVEAARVVERVAALERDQQAALQDADDAEKALQRAEAAVGKVGKASAAIRRTLGEIVDERLAELSPLFREMYARLRPHPEWHDIDYRVRGDVKRFLSLQVGEALNPRFLFSAGQRRAAGLAFLLSVHLARRWSSLKTLFLDDPVQHIDDFRALHFAEVLTAMRKRGCQVVCTVEDEALADMLCRRLRAVGGEGGVKITLGYESGRGVRVLRQDPISPYSPAILIAG